MKSHALQKRILWSALLITVYVLGQFIILPTVKPAVGTNYLRNNTLLNVLGMYTGAQTNRPVLLMLGIGPYMSTNIILQTVMSLDLKSLRQISQYTWGIITNFFSLIIALLQAILYVYNFRQALRPITIGQVNISFQLTVMILTAGGMISIFLANIISDRGIGGSAILMLPQLVISMPALLTRGWGTNSYTFTAFNLIIVFLTTIITIVIGMALIRAQEQVPLRDPQLTSNFSKSYFPIGLLTAGAMPFMFSTSLFMFLPLLSKNGSFAFKQFTASLVSIKQPLGIAFYALIIVLLNFVFGLITIQPSVKARKLKENGNYFYHVVPGAATEKFIMHKFSRLTWISSLILVVMSIWPLILGMRWPDFANLTPYIGNLFILMTIIYAVEQEFKTLSSEQRYVIELE